MTETERAIAIIEARLPLYTDIGQINALRECISSIRSTPPPGETGGYPAPVDRSRGDTIVSVKTMRLSDGRADHFVSIKVGDREVHPHVFRDEFKAAYHVALYSWLLTGTDEPDLMAFNEGEWPAQTTEIVGADPAQIAILEERIGQLENELDEAQQAPWPDWATSILKALKANGYDPVDTDGTVDLGEAFADYLEGISHEDDRLQRIIGEKDGEISRLRAAPASEGSAE